MEWGSREEVKKEEKEKNLLVRRLPHWSTLLTRLERSISLDFFCFPPLCAYEQRKVDEGWWNREREEKRGKREEEETEGETKNKKKKRES